MEMIKINLDQAITNEEWYTCYNKFGNSGPIKINPITFHEISLEDVKYKHHIDDKYKIKNWSFWVLKVNVIALANCDFYCDSISSRISNFISIIDNNGNTYYESHDEFIYDESSLSKPLELKKFDKSIVIPNCKYVATTLFFLPDYIANLSIELNDIPKSWYTIKHKHKNQVNLSEAVASNILYRCVFEDTPDLDIRIQVINFEIIPLSEVFPATLDSGYFYNCEECNFWLLSLNVANLSKRESNVVGKYLFGRLILLDNNGIYYEADGPDLTKLVFGNNVLLQPLTPKIKYVSRLIFSIPKAISSLSIGLRYGLLEEL